MPPPSLLPIIFTLITLSLFGGFEDHLKKAPNKTNKSRMQNIDFIYLINLDQRPEKLAKSMDQLGSYGISPYRFSAVCGWDLTVEQINDIGVKYAPGMPQNTLATCYIPGEDGTPTSQHEVISPTGRAYFVHCMGRGTIGIALSHLSILKDALESGYKTIWVMEDDIDVLQDPRVLPNLIKKLDKLVGKKGWDILFTDIDFKDPQGNHVPCLQADLRRPNFAPSNPDKFARREKISSDFSRIGARYGAHSMIIRRSGIRKLLNFYRQYSVFLPYDMDYILPPNINLFALNYDLISQLTHAISDNGTPPPK